MALVKKTYSFSVPASKFWKLYVPVAILACAVSIVAGFFFIDLLVMPRVVGIERDQVEVPLVINLPFEQAREKLFAVGLLTEMRSRDFDGKVPEDAVISQTPESGVKVKKGRRISVVVSKGKEISVVPDVRDMTERQARMELKKRGFIPGEVKRKFHEKQAADKVIETFPLAGTTISREMKVDLIISKGARPTTAEMPNIVGESLAEATKKIEESGLKVGTIHYRNDPSLLPGTVISQSISPGESVPFSAAVDMTVSVIQ